MRKGSNGVSTIVGEILLVAISIASFSLIFYYVTTNEFIVIAEPSPSIIGYPAGTNYCIKHEGGLSCNATLYLDSEVIETKSDFKIGDRFLFPRPSTVSTALLIRDDGSVLFFSKLLPYTIVEPSINLDPVRVAVENKNILLNETFNVTIFINPNQWIKGYEYKVKWNASILHCNWFQYGNLFKNFSVFYNMNVTINNSAGNITMIYSCIIGNNNTSSNGTIGLISFNATAVGITTIELYEVGVCNETKYLSFNLSNGTVVVTESEDPMDPAEWINVCGNGEHPVLNGTALEFLDNSISQYYCWQHSFNETSSFLTFTFELKEMLVAIGQVNFFGIEILDVNGLAFGTMYSTERKTNNKNGYYCVSDFPHEFFQPYNALNKVRTWEIKVNVTGKRMHYAVYENSTLLAQSSWVRYRDLGSVYPKYIKLFTSEDRVSKTNVYNIVIG